MTEYLKEELIRLVDLLPQTDPRTQDYHVLLRSIESLDAIGSTVDAVVDLVGCEPPVYREARAIEITGAKKFREEVAEGLAEEKKFSEEAVAKIVELSAATAAKEEVKGTTVAENATTAPTTEPEPKKEEAVINPADVRKALVDAKGRGVDVKQILGSMGAENFRELSADRYGELLDLLEVM